MDYRITPFSLIHSIEFQAREEKNDFQLELIKLMIRKKRGFFFFSLLLSPSSIEHLFCLDTLERRRSRKDLVTTIKMTDLSATFFFSFSFGCARAVCFLFLHILSSKCEIKQVKEHSNHHTSSSVGLSRFSSLLSRKSSLADNSG